MCKNDSNNAWPFSAISIVASSVLGNWLSEKTSLICINCQFVGVNTPTIMDDAAIGPLRNSPSTLLTATFALSLLIYSAQFPLQPCLPLPISSF
jgi:hypothetical protein